MADGLTPGGLPTVWSWGVGKDSNGWQKAADFITGAMPEEGLAGLVDPMDPAQSEQQWESGLNGFENDAAMFFGLDSEMANSQLEGPTSMFDKPGRMMDRMSSQTGRVMLQELTTGAKSQIQMLSKALSWEMEDPDKIVQLQMEMVQHGLLPTGEEGFITWGVVDGPTQRALANLASGKAARPGQSWTQFLDVQQQIAEKEISLKLGGEEAKKAQELNDLAQSLSQTLNLTLASSDAIRENAQTLAKSLTGKEMNNSQLDQFVSSIHSKQRQNFWNDPNVQQAQAQIAEATDAYLEVKGGSKDELSKFMSAIETTESGGNPNAKNPYSGAFGLYQFMPGTWNAEAKRFGLDPSDRSPENQRRVAEATMSRYYSMFGNWRDVAIAWYAGPASKHIGTQGSSNEQANGHISIRGYADKVLGLMNTNSSAQTVARGITGVGNAALPGIMGGTVGGTALSAAAEASRQQLATPGIKDSVFAETLPSLTVNETEAFDVNAYLKNLVETTGGVDVDSYRYLTTAKNFEDLLGGI